MKRAPVLVIVDEMAQLGPHMKILENCMGMAAGAAGIQLWCGVTMWFGARDQSTRDYVSKLAGTSEVVTRSRNANIDRQTGEVVVGETGSQLSRPLIHPHEVGQLAKDEMIAFVEGVNGPIRAKRKPYWKVGKFRGKFRKNPYVNSNGGGLLGKLFG
jgi:type IV secretory pathway TraG/TraD family ATPase VirD4